MSTAVSPSLPSLTSNQGKISGDSFLHNVIFAVEGSGFPGRRWNGDGAVGRVFDRRPALVDERAEGGGREEGRDSGPSGTNTLRCGGKRGRDMSRQRDTEMF